MTTTLCLTGWQQDKNELAAIAPGALHFDYAAFDNMDAMFSALPRAPRVAIGWSLGGQLLARAIAEGFIKPSLLLLISTPFQCVANEQFPFGMPEAGMNEFMENYSSNPSHTVTQFNALVGLGDARAPRVIGALNREPKIWDNGLFWLSELAKYTLLKTDFSHFPETIIVHGEGDKVIDVANAKTFKKNLPASQLLLWPQCGHAPYLHNPDALRVIVSNYV